MQRFVSERNVATVPPAPAATQLGNSTQRAPSEPNIPLLPTLLAVLGPAYVTGWVFLTRSELWYAPAGGSAVVLLGSAWLLERSRWSSGRLPVRSAIGRAMVALIGAWIVCTGIVLLSGLRYDAHKYLPQTALLLSNIPVFFAVAAASRQFDARRAIVFLCHGLVAIAVSSILLDFVGVTDFEIHGGNRYFGFIGDVAPWLLTLPLIVYFTTLRFYLSAVVAVVMLLTLSRGPALLIGGAFLLLFIFSKGRRLHYAATLIPVIGVLILQSDMASGLLGRFESTSLTENDRILTSINGIKLFLTSPIWGSGYNALEYFYPPSAISNRRGEFSIPTSSFVQMLSEGGLILFFAYLAFVLTATAAAVRILRTADQEGSGVMVGVAAWLISMLWINQSAPWFLVGSPLAPLVFAAAGLVAGYSTLR